MNTHPLTPSAREGEQNARLSAREGEQNARLSAREGESVVSLSAREGEFVDCHALTLSRLGMTKYGRKCLNMTKNNDK
ncbi:hypothetical protein DMC01_02305 [Campylobacter troglodytis]|nr:hypothetical protein DMC01_02305 [Campylobacter troglodytis]